jgi:hypothetical protein
MTQGAPSGIASCGLGERAVSALTVPCRGLGTPRPACRLGERGVSALELALIAGLAGSAGVIPGRSDPHVSLRVPMKNPRTFSRVAGFDPR